MIALKKLVGPPLRQLTGRSVRWSADDLIAAARPAGRALESDRAFVAAVNAAHAGGSEPDFAVRADSPGAAVSEVPYVAGGTELLIHNFFAHNYAIRDAVLYRVSLLAPDRANASRQFVLGVNETRHLDVDAFLKPPAGAPARGTILVSAHHPRIRVPANQLRYIVLYRSRSGLAGVHSMAAAFRDIPRSHLGYRAIAPQTVASGGRFAAAGLRGDFIPLDPGEPIAWASPPPVANDAFMRMRTARSFYSTPCYLLAFDNGGACTAVWHDGNNTHRLAGPSRGAGEARAAFGLSPVSDALPVIAVDSDQIGQPAQRLSIALVDNGGRTVAERRLDTLPAERFALDLAALFAGVDLPASSHVVCDFGFDASPQPQPAELMLHVYRRNADGLLDQMHTIRTRALSIGDGPRASATRARKFCPLLVGNGRRTVFTISNLGPWGDLPETVVALRVFTDLDGELLHRVPLPANGIRTFEAADFVPADGRARVGALWIEHQTVNMFAHWWVCEDGKPGAACDHFTGG